MEIEKFTEPRCPVCQSENRDEIDKLLSEGQTFQKDIAAKFGFSDSQISNHKSRHLLLNIPEKLREMANRALMKNLECKDVGDLTRLLDHIERWQERDCAKCVYRLGNEPKKDLGQVIAEYLDYHVQEEKDVENTKTG